MKNISTHVAIAVVSLVLVIASAFLMTAPEAGMRLIGEYVTLFWAVVFTASATRALLLERSREEKHENKPAHAAAEPKAPREHAVRRVLFLCRGRGKPVDGRPKMGYSRDITRPGGLSYEEDRSDHRRVQRHGQAVRRDGGSVRHL